VPLKIDNQSQSTAEQAVTVSMIQMPERREKQYANSSLQIYVVSAILVEIQNG
tara:strand:+ start:116191 stop:116349 length:159 start_codon:yes stop_codon:yes gene_type:complete